MFYKHQQVPQNAVSVARKAKQFTQVDLAEVVDVTRQTIIAIEKGNYTPSVLLALKLAQALSETVEELFWL